MTLPNDPSKSTLLLGKHADYIEAFEKDKDDYVMAKTKRPLLCPTVCCVAVIATGVLHH